MTRIGSSDHSRPPSAAARGAVASERAGGAQGSTADAAPPSTTDSYEAGSADAGLPVPENGAEPKGVTVVQAFSASRAQGRERLVHDLEALKQRLTTAIRPLPDLAEDAAQQALEISADRIVKALDRGDITLDEARRAEHMLAELINGLLAIEQGSYTVDRIENTNAPGCVAYDVHTTQGDTLRVTVRAQGGEGGQARLKIHNVTDDGQKVDAGERIMVRFDLEGSEVAGSDALSSVIDVQLGEERTDPTVLRLNKRIHGVVLDEAGQPVVNRAGRLVADHHFDGLPDALDDRVRFEAFVQEFLDDLVGRQGGET